MENPEFTPPAGGHFLPVKAQPLTRHYYLHRAYNALPSPSGRTGGSWWANPVETFASVLISVWTTVPLIVLFAIFSSSAGLFVASILQFLTESDSRITDLGIYAGGVIILVGIFTIHGLILAISTVAAMFFVPYIENPQRRLWTIFLLCVWHFINGFCYLPHPHG